MLTVAALFVWSAVVSHWNLVVGKEIALNTQRLGISDELDRSLDAVVVASNGNGRIPIPKNESVFVVEWTTSVASPAKSIVVQMNRSWAPIGFDRFHQLVLDNYYNGAAFFRVAPGFVVQFGIASDPNVTAQWNHPIRDDPVRQSNTRGTVSFATAGPNTRTAQLFINLQDNPHLDQSGFAPIGVVLSGMDVVASIFNPTPDSSGGVDQEAYETKGNAWILSEYPGIDFIQRTTIRYDETVPLHAQQSLNATALVPRKTFSFDSSSIPWLIIGLVMMPLWTIAILLKEVEARRRRMDQSQRAPTESNRLFRSSGLV